MTYEELEEYLFYKNLQLDKMSKYEKAYYETMIYNFSRKQKYNILLHPTDFFGKDKIYSVILANDVFTTSLYYDGDPLTYFYYQVRSKRNYIWKSLKLDVKRNIEKIDDILSSGNSYVSFSPNKNINNTTKPITLTAYYLKDVSFYFSNKEDVKKFISNEIKWLT